jgi:3-isopropylmalate/(R)-2-methylmalate dehydratase small subunit
MNAPLLAPKVWKFGDNIDTDLMVPGPYLWKPPEERVRGLFQANRPGWVDQVRPGDALVAGLNFGIGSSRPGALSLRLCGLAFVLAESINGLFFRTAVNFGLPAFEAPGVSAAFEEGDGAELSLQSWTARNARTGATIKLTPVHEMLLSLMLGGGVVPLMEKQGLIGKSDPEQLAKYLPKRRVEKQG